MSEEALKLALAYVQQSGFQVGVNEVVTAIKEALAQPEQKYRRGNRLICLETEEYCVIHISGTDRQWVKFPDSHVGVYTNEQVAELFELLPKEPEPVKLWLWKNFVDGRPEYWAFDNAFPINMNDGDPQTLGQPCGYAWLKPSRQGRFDVSDKEVLSAIKNAKEYPPQPKEPEQEPVAFEMDWPDYHVEAMGCGLEDRNITDRYEAMQYGWDEAIERIAERLPEVLYTTPPQPQSEARGLSQSKPLTDEQIDKAMAENKQTLIDAADNYWKMRRAYARIIEAAHGIKE